MVVARKAKGLTQTAAGARIGVEGMTISRWERRISLPNRKQWPKIEEVLGVSREAVIRAYAAGEPAGATP